MTDIESFRTETRDWLKANCPPEMREPMRSEADACWGGRNAVFQSDAQRQWMERMAERGWTVPHWLAHFRRAVRLQPIAGFGAEALDVGHGCSQA